MTVTDREFTVRFMAVDHQTMESKEIYRVTVYSAQSKQQEAQE